MERELLNEVMDALTNSYKLGVTSKASNLIDKWGVVEAISILMKTAHPQEGFIKLYWKGRLDLSFENIILKEKYRELFTRHTLEVAEKRLKDFNFVPKL